MDGEEGPADGEEHGEVSEGEEVGQAEEGEPGQGPSTSNSKPHSNVWSREKVLSRLHFWHQRWLETQKEFAAVFDVVDASGSDQYAVSLLPNKEDLAAHVFGARSLAQRQDEDGRARQHRARGQVLRAFKSMCSCWSCDPQYLG